MRTSNRRIKAILTLAALALTGLCLEAGATDFPGELRGPDATPPAENKPLKVFILSGQPNMQGHAHVRTFDAMRLAPKTAPILEEMRDADGAPRLCERVWITSIGTAEEEQVGRLTAGFGAERGGPKIGPEFTFGIYMQKLLDEPILIIKTAWGGKSLNTHSAGGIILATGDRNRLPDLKRITMEIVRGQSEVGPWGHRSVQRTGRLAGYGMMNAPGLPLTIG